jgi:hypothetical protein
MVAHEAVRSYHHMVCARDLKELRSSAADHRDVVEGAPAVPGADSHVISVKALVIECVEAGRSVVESHLETTQGECRRVAEAPPPHKTTTRMHAG